MALSVADILRWDPESARDLGRAASSRAAAATDVADGLRRLPALASWEGHGADAASAANSRLQIDLRAHGQDATSVSRAAHRAADGMEQVQRDLRQLRFDAEDRGMLVEPASSRIVSGPGFRGTPAQLAANLAELEPRLVAIQAEAEQVEAQFASAITASGSDTPKAGVQAVDFKQAPVPDPGTPDDPVGGAHGPTRTGAATLDPIKNLPEGSKPSIREVRTPEDLQKYWDWSTQNASPYQSDPPYRKGLGIERQLDDGTVLRMGPSSPHGQTMDITTADGQTIKLHINPKTGGDITIPETPVESVPRPAEPTIPPPRPIEGSAGIAGAEGSGSAPAGVIPGEVAKAPFGEGLGGAPGTEIGPQLVPAPHSERGLPTLGEAHPGDEEEFLP
jgi:hypothetical protein